MHHSFTSLPRRHRRSPRGGGLLDFIAFIAVAVLTGGIGVGILALIDSNSCTINIFWGCSNDNSTVISGTGVAAGYCVSPPNACGQRNVGTESSYQEGEECGWYDYGEGASIYECKPAGPVTISCSATTPPPDSNCPAPTISAEDYYANPRTVRPGNASTLTWNAADATGCVITSDTGFSHSGDASGSVSTGAITETGVYTLVCRNGDNGPAASRSIRIAVDPTYIEI